MYTFQLEMREIRKTADFHSNLQVSWELVTEGDQGKPLKCAHLSLFHTSTSACYLSNGILTSILAVRIQTLR